jgi:DNA-binding response OmpR family regulator
MVASGIKLGLTDAGYAVDWVGSGERAEDVLRNESSMRPSSTSACRAWTGWS